MKNLKKGAFNLPQEKRDEWKHILVPHILVCWCVPGSVCVYGAGWCLSKMAAQSQWMRCGTQLSSVSKARVSMLRKPGSSAPFPCCTETPQGYLLFFLIFMFFLSNKNIRKSASSQRAKGSHFSLVSLWSNV